MDNFSKNIRNIRQHGFTLIELIVVVTIIGILAVTLGSLFNPLAQIQKAKNSTRQQDMNQIKSALDTYYNDTGCYPTSLPFWSSLKTGATVYMEKVPEDPDCSSSNVNNCYDYQTDGSSCPQWNIIYAQLHTPILTSIAPCVVTTAPNCLPSPGGILSYNYCAVSGKLDCGFIHANSLPVPSVPPGWVNNGGNGGSGGNGGNNPPIPTPTINCSTSISACSNGVCNNLTGASSQCLGCGGSTLCYQGLNCGGVVCR